MSLQAYISFMRNEMSSIEEIVENIIKDNKGKILSMIKLRLYQRGIDGDGNKITPEYTSITVSNKKDKRQITSHVTLRDTGEWYKSFYVYYDNGEIIVSSNSFKTSQLVEKYGESILELTDQEIQLIINAIIEPELIRRINSFTQIEIDF